MGAGVGAGVGSGDGAGVGAGIGAGVGTWRSRKVREQSEKENKRVRVFCTNVGTWGKRAQFACKKHSSPP